ncbi:MAG: sulfite exporter TauE/SafE family protein [Nocardioides sp.]|uniref:sulfite exporter TauE/SafE family protein n=1 Tax=Nocardioides sp. TaxID=35761 RepID=UPI003F110935
MQKLLMFALVGVAAQLVDGSLGMAYGVTSTTLLLMLGTHPAMASMMVQFAQLGTTAVSGVAHHSFGNVDWRVVRTIALPGAIGAFLGARALVWLSDNYLQGAKALMAVLLLGLGIYLLSRFTISGFRTDKLDEPPTRKFLVPLGGIAGFVDATAGGGWGPIGTPALLASGRMEPRKVIGSVSTSEFLVTLAASIGFITGLSLSDIDWRIVAGLLLGGAIVAPLAALLVKVIPPRMLGSLVGGLIILTNTRTLINADLVAVPGALAVAIYLAIVAVWAWAIRYSWRAHKAEQATQEPALAGLS